MTNYNLLATVAAGIESVTAQELKQLGYQVQTENGRVRFSGNVQDIAKTNLWLRTADRIKIKGRADGLRLRHCRSGYDRSFYRAGAFAVQAHDGKKTLRILTGGVAFCTDQVLHPSGRRCGAGAELRQEHFVRRERSRCIRSGGL